MLYTICVFHTHSACKIQLITVTFLADKIKKIGVIEERGKANTGFGVISGLINRNLIILAIINSLLLGKGLGCTDFIFLLENLL